MANTQSGQGGLFTHAARAMGYGENSRLMQHGKMAFKLHNQMGGPPAQAWNAKYKKTSMKLNHLIHQQPIGVQKAIHNHVLHTVTKNNPNFDLTKTGHVNDFMKSMKDAHDHVGRFFGQTTTQTQPPKITTLGAALHRNNYLGNMGVKVKGQPFQPAQRPDAGVNTSGVPSNVAKGAQRAALGMNPLPPAMRHATPLALAPDKGVMPGAKAMANPVGTPASEGGMV